MTRLFTTLGLIAALTFTAAGAPSPASAAESQGPSWSVAPAPAADGSLRPNFDYQLDPGSTIDDTFTVRNNGATALQLGVYAADAFTTREGNIDLLAAGHASVDSGTWVTLSQSTITLQPGQLVQVPFTLTVPADARPGDHPTGIVTSLLSDDENATVQVDRRLGSRMQIRVSGALHPSVAVSHPRVDFSGMWSWLATGTLTVSFDLTNTGNARTTATSTLSAHGPLGIGAVTGPATALPEILPGSTIAVTQRVDGAGALFWPGGEVTLAPQSVGIDGRALSVEHLRFSTPAIPFVLLIVVVLLAAAAAVVVLVRRRRSAGSGSAGSGSAGSGSAGSASAGSASAAPHPAEA